MKAIGRSPRLYNVDVPICPIDTKGSIHRAPRSTTEDFSLGRHVCIRLELASEVTIIDFRVEPPGKSPMQRPKSLASSIVGRRRSWGGVLNLLVSSFYLKNVISIFFCRIHWFPCLLLAYHYVSKGQREHFKKCLRFSRSSGKVP